MKQDAKKVIAREGFIILALVIFYTICLLAAFLLPHTTMIEIISIIVIATVVFGYLLYLIARFVIWAAKILKEK